jgi:hypothetical protein
MKTLDVSLLSTSSEQHSLEKQWLKHSLSSGHVFSISKSQCCAVLGGQKLVK